MEDFKLKSSAVSDEFHILLVKRDHKVVASVVPGRIAVSNDGWCLKELHSLVSTSELRLHVDVG